MCAMYVLPLVKIFFPCSSQMVEKIRAAAMERYARRIQKRYRKWIAAKHKRQEAEENRLRLLEETAEQVRYSFRSLETCTP